MQKDIDIAFFQLIDDRLNNAYEQNDIDQIERLLSLNWTMLEPGIGLVQKTDFIVAIKERRLIHTVMKKAVIHVSIVNGIAVVISKGRNAGLYGGKAFDTLLWVTNIYQKINNEWICVSTQESPIPCKQHDDLQG